VQTSVFVIAASTTEAEIEEKRLKLNAERTIKQNKAAETGKNIAYNYTVTCGLSCK
jgi:hypothetical protein